MVTIHTADSVAAGVAACRLISSNVVSFSFNLVLSDLSFSLNVVPKPRMLLVPTVYVLGPLQLGGRAPPGIGPEFATHGSVRDHKANGIRDFLRPDQPFQLRLRKHFGSDVLFPECPHYRGVGKSRMDHAAADPVIHRLGHESRSSSFQACFGRGVGDLSDIAD